MASNDPSGVRDGIQNSAAPPAASPAAPATPPAEEWRASWASTLPQLEAISRQLRPRRDVTIMRSSQLDAERLDEELGSMLREQFMRAFALFPPSAVARLLPELSLLLDFLIFRFSVWEGRPLPGMSLMNLRYRNEAAVQPLPAGGSSSSSKSSCSSGNAPTSSSTSSTRLQDAVCVAGGRSGVEGPGLSTTQRSLYCLGAVFLRYGWARLSHHAAAQHWGDASTGSNSWRRRAWVLMRRAESAYRLASLVNFLDFLRTGRYRSVLERLLRTRLVYGQPSAARAISFEYLNRQLVWSELGELLLFLLPLVNARAIKHALRCYLPRLPMLGGSSGGTRQPGGRGSGGPTPQQQLCGICSVAEILQPYAAVPCGHRFCYYCLRSQCLADPQYSCPLCLRRVEAMQQVGPVQPSANADAAAAGSGDDVDEGDVGPGASSSGRRASAAQAGAERAQKGGGLA